MTRTTPNAELVRERVLEWLEARRDDDAGDTSRGYHAGEIAVETGLALYGGRSVAGALQRLERNGLARTVPRTDGRGRPLLYRATTDAERERREAA